MIEIKLPNPNKKPSLIPLAFTPHKPKLSLVQQEASKRDILIKKLYKECPYNVGDTVVPVDELEKKKYGDVVVEGICKSYAEFGKDVKWHEGNPMIVTFFSPKMKCRIFCTTDFLEAKENG